MLCETMPCETIRKPVRQTKDHQLHALVSTSMNDWLTIAEVGLGVEHAAYNKGTNVPAPGLHRLAPLQYHHWQPSLSQFQRSK